jgi:glycine cleavage system H protein
MMSRVQTPDDLRYTREHEWARDEGQGKVRVGITDYAQDALGDVVYVDLPDVGTEVHAGQAFAEVESTKSVSDVFSPIEGSIVERNPLIDEHSELVNEQPYGDGWLVLLQPVDLAAVEGLLDAAAYRAFVEEGSQ